MAGTAVLNYSTDSLLEARITLRVRVPRIHIGDNLAQIKAMRLANVQTFGSNVWRPNINLSAPQIDFSWRGAETWGFHESPSYPHVWLSGLERKN